MKERPKFVLECEGWDAVEGRVDVAGLRSPLYPIPSPSTIGDISKRRAWTSKDSSVGHVFDSAFRGGLAAAPGGVRRQEDAPDGSGSCGSARGPRGGPIVRAGSRSGSASDASSPRSTFFEVPVDVDSARRKAWMFVMRSMPSGANFAWLYDGQDQVSFLDGHARAAACVRLRSSRLRRRASA